MRHAQPTEEEGGQQQGVHVRGDVGIDACRVHAALQDVAQQGEHIQQVDPEAVLLLHTGAAGGGFELLGVNRQDSWSWRHWIPIACAPAWLS